MATLRCVKCGERWELDSLHDEAAARLTELGVEPSDARYGPSWPEEVYRPVFNQVREDFVANGCRAFSFAASCPGYGADPRIALVYEMMGSDIDGASSELEDLEAFF